VREAALKQQAFSPGWYRLGKVTQARVDKAMARSSGHKVATFSLEDSASGDMEIEFNDHLSPSTSVKLRAGDPCVTGVVQIVIDPKTNTPTALFDVHHWVKFPNGPTSKSIYGTGVLPDTEWPTLKYTNSPSPDCMGTR
jgi:hypothetical protein